MRQANSVIYGILLWPGDLFRDEDATLSNQPEVLISVRKESDMPTQSPNRRSFIKWAAAAPLLSQIAARNLYAQAATAIGKDPRQNVYTRLGLKTVINCRGTWTYLSGSLEFPEVR